MKIHEIEARIAELDEFIACDSSSLRTDAIISRHHLREKLAELRRAENPAAAYRETIARLVAEYDTAREIADTDRMLELSTMLGGYRKLLAIAESRA